VRIIQGDSIHSVISHLEKVVHDERVQLKLKGPFHMASAISDTTTRAWRILRTTISDQFPGMLVTPVLAPGTTDSRHFAALANTILRFIPVTITNDNKEMVHGIGERIEIREYLQMIRFYKQLIKNFSNKD
jgi:carboxypeptidase PM20D1